MYAIFPYIYHTNQSYVGTVKLPYMDGISVYVKNTYLLVSSNFTNGNVWLITPHLPAISTFAGIVEDVSKGAIRFRPSGGNTEVSLWPVGGDGGSGKLATKKAFLILKV